MIQPLDFELRVYHNRYLPAGHRVLDAVISVNATGDAGPGGAPPSAAQVIMIDCSGSMGGEKIVEAKRATAIAVDLLRDEVAFAIVAGTTGARMVYPPNRTMVPASSVTRAEARSAIRTLTADGGTAIGTWLELANALFAERAEEIKHAILLTDGHNVHQSREALLRTLARCRGRFGCEPRGVGKDWSSETLWDVADALLGKADGLPEPAALTAEFQAITEAVMGKAAADLTLRVWHPRGARIRFLKQVYPHVQDLSERGTPDGELITGYPTGSWGTEYRDYHLSVELPPDTKIGDKVLAAHVTMTAGDAALAEALVPAVWTDDAALSTKINDRVAHYTGQVELDLVTQDGFADLREGKVDDATAKLRLAIKLAEELGRKDTVQVIGRVIEVDESTGTAKLRANMEQVDAEMAAVRSRVTVRWRAD